MKKRINNLSSVLLRYVLGIAIIAWLFETNQLNVQAIFSIDGRKASVALCLCVLQLILSAWRVKVLLAARHIYVSLYNCTLYNAVGVFYSLVLPGGISGDAVRAYYFWRCDHANECSKSALVGALVTDRLIGTLVMLFVGLLAATFSAKTINISLSYLIAMWLAYIVGISIYVFICGTHNYKWKTKDCSRFKSTIERVKRLFAQLDLTDYSARVLSISVLSSIFIHISTVVVIFLFVLQLGSGLNFGEVMAVAPIGLLVNALPISPGGLGVGEKGFELLFSLIGGQYGGNVFMLSRIFIFSPAVIGAGFTFFPLFFNRFRHVPSSEGLV